MGREAKSRIVIGKPKVVWRKLNKNIYGEAYHDEYRVILRKGLKSKVALSTLIHELAHLILPDASETKIRQIESILIKEIWKLGYRKIAK
jgi:hypothetical protein